MQSAMGRVQLGKLDQWIEKRRENAGVLIEGLAGVPGLRVPVPDAHVGHAWYKFYAYVEPERLKAGWSRDAVMQAVSEKGVPCMQGICPEVYREIAFRSSGQWSELRGQRAEGQGARAKKRGQRAAGDLRPERRLAAAKDLGETSLMFLVHPTLGKREMEETVRVVRGVMEQAV
jgi:dTDP-4-amino-4,6-dideoxygalactose transaminase